ncbi:MAG TPA: OmpW family outer membrane protein [Thermoanaerobaculia bacterium]|jgi:outer membrane protein W
MKRALLFCSMLLIALPSLAQRVDLILDVEGVRRNDDGPSRPIRYDPTFETGGGIGGGVNWHFSGRTSLEVKIAALVSEMHVQITGSDFVARANLGRAQMYPITAVLQWHPVEKGSLRPYLGVGVAHVITRNIEATPLTPAIEFEDPTGLVLDAGLRIPFSKRWSLAGDARYVPVETRGSARFGSDDQVAELHVRPLVVGVGIVYHY